MVREKMMSQYGQDATILYLLDGKREGFFVELGAGNGVNLSNSYYFEKFLDWKGLLIEPYPDFYESIINNRKCFISNELCGEFEGVEVDFLLAGEVSGILEEVPSYWLQQNIKNNKIKLTTTVLSKILDKFSCPKEIDFLSIDVEGQEFPILNSFPFNEYSFKVICAEHNSYCEGEENRNNIKRILEQNGYELVLAQSQDDFYMKRE
jgi:hypothetical protein